MKNADPAGREPLWRDEFAVESAHERYVTRRQFAKFLTLTSLGMLVGNLVILARSLTRRGAKYLGQDIAQAGEIPVGAVKIFHYPEPKDACLLIRTGPESYVAYSQKCTHLSCAVFYDPSHNRIECPCHHGFFSVEDGRVLQGPPPRPLPKVKLEHRGSRIVATGIDAAPEGSS